MTPRPDPHPQRVHTFPANQLGLKEVNGARTPKKPIPSFPAGVTTVYQSTPLKSDGLGGAGERGQSVHLLPSYLPSFRAREGERADRVCAVQADVCMDWKS